MCNIVTITVSSLYDTLTTQYHCLENALHCLKTQDFDLDTKIGWDTKLDWI